LLLEGLLISFMEVADVSYELLPLFPSLHVEPTVLLSLVLLFGPDMVLKLNQPLIEAHRPERRDLLLLKRPLADPLSAIELPQHVEIAVHVTGGGGFCLNDIL